MRFSLLSANWKLTATSNKILLGANAVLAVAVAVLAGLATANRERVTVVPPTVDQALTVNWSSATPDYLKSMGLFFSGVIGQTGPQNLPYVIKTVEKFAAPAVAEGIKTKLQAMAASYDFRTNTARAWFEGDKLYWEPPTRKVFVSGYLHSISPTGKYASQAVVYEYIIDIVEGRPVISHFDSYRGLTPHTQAWLDAPNNVREDGDRKARAERETREALERDVREDPAVPGERIGSPAHMPGDNAVSPEPAAGDASVQSPAASASSPAARKGF